MKNRTKYTAQKSINRKEMGMINGGTHPGFNLLVGNAMTRFIYCPSAGPAYTGASVSGLPGKANPV